MLFRVVLSREYMGVLIIDIKLIIIEYIRFLSISALIFSLLCVIDYIVIVLYSIIQEVKRCSTMRNAL